MNLWFFESNPEIFRSGTIFVVLLCFESKTGFEMLKLWLSIKVFIKGMIMGAVNVFPISSGTMSLVLGVFERFVNSVKALNHKNFKYLHRGQLGEFARRTDIKFLATIVVGILTGMILTSILLKKSTITCVRLVKLSRSSGVHQSNRLPSLSYREPWSSKP